MPKYTANSYLFHEGKVVKTGDELELNIEQAERLGDKVIHHEFEENKAYNEYKVATLRDFAKQRDIEGYYDMKKDELVKSLEEYDQNNDNNTNASDSVNAVGDATAGGVTGTGATTGTATTGTGATTGTAGTTGTGGNV